MVVICESSQITLLTHFHIISQSWFSKKFESQFSMNIFIAGHEVQRKINYKPTTTVKRLLFAPDTSRSDMACVRPSIDYVVWSIKFEIA